MGSRSDVGLGVSVTLACVLIAIAVAYVMLDGAEFKHPSIARFTVDRHVSRVLSPSEATRLAGALNDDGFWQLLSEEPEHGCWYDGPHWFLEGRSGGYHSVMRAWEKDQILRSARLFMQLAGMQGEKNTAPEAAEQ